MSYIPDTTVKYQMNIYGKETDNPKIPNGYYEGLLPDDYKKQLIDVDLTIDEAINTFFSNIDCYADDLSKVGINTDDIDETSVVSDDLTEEDIKKLNLTTKQIGTIRDCLQHWLAHYRNDVIVSMIDNIPEEKDNPYHIEYREKYKEIFGKYPDEE